MASPPIPINFNGSAYRNSSSYHQNLAYRAWYFISRGQLEPAFDSLNKLLEDQALDSNPLIIETYMMIGKIALDRQLYAEACVNFQLAANPHMLACARRGSDRENLPIYEANEAMIKYLQKLVCKPRMLNRRARKFSDERDFTTCHTDTLRGWAFGQDMIMPAPTDSIGLASLRKALRERYSQPRGDYLLIPPHGKPFVVPYSEAVSALSGARDYKKRDYQSHCIYHDDLLERIMGNATGWPEGHFFRLYEAVVHQQRVAAVAEKNLQPNPLATALLHWPEELYGPVLVQMCYLLKHRDTRKSVIAVRKPLTLEFLSGAEWKRMRMEYRAMIRVYGMEGVIIRRDELEMRTEAARLYHIHADL